MMDPQAAWNQLLDAYASDDWDSIEEPAEGLLGWLKRGGFPPQTIAGRQFDRGLNVTLARAACDFLLEEKKRR
jgi:hypothetical protein